MVGSMAGSPARRVARRDSLDGTNRRASTGSLVATPSRHIDFRGVSQDDELDDDAAVGDARHASRKRRTSDGGARVSFSHIVEEEPTRYVADRTPELRRRDTARRDHTSSDDEATGTASSQERGQQSPNSRSRRRKVVHWTKHEEHFIIQGVKKHGLGQWRKILEDGHGVFHKQRTNVDIKDKWKNLARKVPMTQEEEEIADTRIWRETVAARMIERLLPSLQKNPRRVIGDGSEADADTADDDIANEDDEEGDDVFSTAARAKRRRLSHSRDDELQFYIGTDASAPHLRAVTITPRDCPTISALKRVLSRQLLEDAPLPTNLLLVSIHTRRLLGDLESVEECAQRDGRELYLLYDP